MERSERTSWTLVARAAGGDSDSREAFARIYGPVIAAYLAARWRVALGADEVQDAMNEVFLQCFKQGGALGRVEDRREGGFRAYLYGITRNVAGTLRQAHRKEASGESAIAGAPSDEQTMSQVFDRAYAVALTREARYVMAMNAATDLGASQRLRALELMYEEGMPSREVAQRLGIEPSAVYPLLTRARKDFKVALLQVMAENHPGETLPELENRCLDVLSAL